MSYSGLAKTILQLVGGAENVDALVHCATRLRFTLHDNGKAKKEELKNLDGILSAVESGGQFQVIVGSHVSHVYKELMSLLSGGMVSSAERTESKPKGNIGSRIFEVVSGSFSPLIGAMAGSGMIKALLAVLTMMGWMDATSSTYLVLAAAANSVFYFLPVLLGISAAIKMGANGYIGGAIGAALLEPNFTGLIGSHTATFFGIPVVAINYASTVFPVFIAVAILAVLEKFLKRVCPHNIQMFMVPMLCLLVIVPMTVLAFGPFGVYLGNLIADGINWLSAHSGILTGAVIGGSMMFLVVLGLHWGIVPIIIANLGAGGDPISGMWAPATFAQMGVALAIFLRSKDVNVKALAGPATVTGLLAGVTEPIIYGLIMRFRRTIPIVVLAGAVGGALNGAFQAKQTAFAFHSLLSIPVFTPVLQYAIGIGTGFGLALLLTLMFGFENKTVNAASQRKPMATTTAVTTS
nr:PTS transporter subunit EIIC [uncultured Tolumonas sp.]